jgi:hypothetical protein
MKSIKIYVVSWAILVIGGFISLDYYSYRSPGISLDQAFRGPTALLPKVMLFLHPKCSCSFASLTEFSNLLSVMKNKADLEVIFAKPAGMSEATLQGELWNEALKLSGVKVSVDELGVEHKKFGVSTSGEMLLFNEQGEKVFHGGLTPSRGHVGLSKGQIFVKEWFGGNKNKREVANVYGCGLEGKSDEPRK